MSFRRVVKRLIPRRLFRLIEPWGHLGEALLFNIIFGFPGRGLKVIGVTGTNGKTTTSFLIHKMLSEAGLKTGLMTTVAYGVGDDIRPQIEHMTSVSVPTLMKRLRFMRAQKIDWLVLETTSHALAQHRVFGVPFKIAVMTNVTHEHLDYHGSFERYRDAKRKLFKRATTGVINADDPSAELFASDVAQAILYGIKAGELRAKNIKSTPGGNSYEAVSQSGQTYKINTSLPGSFNVYNSLAAVAVGQILDLSKQQIEQGIAALEGVEGRMTRIDEGQKFDVIVDFAHTPDSFEKLFADIAPMVDGRLIAVFGSAGGQRDKLKRPVQGEIAGKHADLVVLTEEDDRDTPGEEILEQIAEGARKAGKKDGQSLFKILDRTEAIKFAFAQAKAGDTVLLLGKGHEKTIERADGEHPWNEAGTAKKLLKRL